MNGFGSNKGLFGCGLLGDTGQTVASTINSMYASLNGGLPMPGGISTGGTGAMGLLSVPTLPKLPKPGVSGFAPQRQMAPGATQMPGLQRPAMPSRQQMQPMYGNRW